MEGSLEMAKKDSKAYKAEISGSGLHRIDGIVREVNDAGVMINIKERGRVVRRATLIPMADIVAYTAEGPGYVVCDRPLSLEPIAGTVVSESAEEIILKDAEDNEIHFPLLGRTKASFVSVAEDDRSLKKSSVETKIARLAEREDGSGGKKKSKKSKPAKEEATPKKKRSGLRRKA
jgi:hypothetical protein